jgi:excisionase family DNA binding protein
MKVSVRSVRKLVASGRLRQVRLSPTLIRFRLEDVKAAVEAMTIQGTTDGGVRYGGRAE